MEQETRISYDGIFKKCFELCPLPSIVGFVNAIFGRDYPLDANVARLNVESNTGKKKRLCDALCRINDDMFHFEVQSKGGEMSLRVFEYSYLAAFGPGRRIENGVLKMKFPESTVIYLRSNENTPKKLPVCLELPGGNTAEYEIATKNMKDIPLSELLKEEMVSLLPFRPMNYERSPNTPIDVEGLKSDVMLMSEELAQRAKGGMVDVYLADFAAKSLKSITENVLLKANTERKEIVEVMEAMERELFLIEPLVWEMRGEERGKIDDAREMFAEGLSYELVQRITKLKPEILNKLKAEVERSKPKN